MPRIGRRARPKSLVQERYRSPDPEIDFHSPGKRGNAEGDHDKGQQGHEENRVAQEPPILAFRLRKRVVEFWLLRFWRSWTGRDERDTHVTDGSSAMANSSKLGWPCELVKRVCRAYF